ncbi:hypothetical protein MMC16_000267 [Acarospora aff. strigata]|nr:hypothetical protein [Acarospora aff. strigata]
MAMISRPLFGPQRQPSISSPGSLYLAYGSNLRLSQMEKRCPSSPYVGVALLRDWRWIINTRGYANIVPSPGDVVYGLVYKLTEEDEGRLDAKEGVPDVYGKRIMDFEFWADGQDLGTRGMMKAGVVYVDEKVVQEGPPQQEYVFRMNRGVEDALERGVPMDYVEGYIRRFIPEEKRV